MKKYLLKNKWGVLTSLLTIVFFNPLLPPLPLKYESMYFVLVSFIFIVHSMRKAEEEMRHFQLRYNVETAKTLMMLTEQINFKTMTQEESLKLEEMYQEVHELAVMALEDYET